MTGTAVRRMPDVVATGIVLAALVAINLTHHLLTTPWWLGPVEAAALLAFARFTGLTWSELGLGGDRLGRGCAGGSASWPSWPSSTPSACCCR